MEVGRTYAVKNVIVCNALPRESFYLQLQDEELNDLLRCMCSFLDNDTHVDKDRNIVLSKHIDDRAHFNSAGDDLLWRNVVDLLNSLSR